MVDYNIKKQLNNNTYYYFYDALHREDGPAIEFADGSEEWYINGKRHNNEGPAIKRVNGDKEWWYANMKHRLDGPAIEHSSGHKEWWVSGKLHRRDGPAIIYADGSETYFINGIEQASRRTKSFTPRTNNFIESNKIRRDTMKESLLLSDNKSNNFKDDAYEGALRALTNESVNAIKNGIVESFDSEGMSSEDEKKFLIRLLNSGLGDALTRFCFGYIGEYIPHPMMKKELAKKVIKELKVSGWEKLTTHAFNITKKSILPGLLNVFEKFESLEKFQ